MQWCKEFTTDVSVRISNYWKMGGIFICPFFFMVFSVSLFFCVFQFRAQAKKAASLKYRNRVETKKGKVRPEKSYSLDPLDDVFCTIQPEDAG